MPRTSGIAAGTIEFCLDPLCSQQWIEKRIIDTHVVANALVYQPGFLVPHKGFHHQGRPLTRSL